MARFITTMLLISTFLLARSVGAKEVHYYYTDPQGTVLAKTDANGNIIARYDYSPYGRATLGESPSGPGFTGHVNDKDTGLVYMQARYYDPDAGRFLSIDPMAIQENGIYDQNRYLYAKGNPVRYVDPDGKKYAELWAKQGAVVGAVSTAGASVAVDAVTGGVNVLATPAEIAGGSVAGGIVGYKLGQLADHIMGTEEHSDATKSNGAETGAGINEEVVNGKSTKTPNEGVPGSVHVNPGSGQRRLYGEDGKPLKDIDVDHDHGQGKPHVHDWGRDENGMPTRGPGRPYDPAKDGF
jgi:RHS repeat-associated protein